MADEEKVRTVVLPVDNDDKSKLAVDCKFFNKQYPFINAFLNVNI